MVDDCTRENLALIADTSLSGARVVRELTALIAEHGRPKMIVSDNGSEFTSNAILAWAGKARVEWHYIARKRTVLGPAPRRRVQTATGSGAALHKWLRTDARRAYPAQEGNPPPETNSHLDKTRGQGQAAGSDGETPHR